jgi:glycosyltransferase involved in cell wall biosynthesis
MVLRVAVVHSFYRSAHPSGENVQVTSEVEALQRAGVEVGLLAARTDDLAGGWAYRWRSAARVATGRGASPRRALTSFAPDLVHVHNLFPNLGRRWVQQVDVPLVATLHNFRFVCANGLLFRDGRPCDDCVTGGPAHGLRHRCYRGSAAATLPLTLAQRRGPEADPVLARADRILCLSRRQRHILTAAGLAADRLVDGDNFLPASLDPGRPAATGPGRRRDGCLYVGRLTPEKGAVELAAGWRGDHVLRIVGDGPQMDEVRRAASGRPVEVLGPLARPAVLDLMGRSAALALPGAWPEVAPLAVVEALASGLPVVARRLSDLAARVEGDGVGAAVDEVADVPTAVASLADDDVLPARCRAVFEARHSEAAWIARALALYAELTGRPDRIDPHPEASHSEAGPT